MGNVDEKVCNEKTKAYDMLVKRVDKTEEEIVDLKVVIERVTTLTELLVRNLNKVSFWSTDNGKLLFKALLFVGIVIIGVSVGKNLDPWWVTG